MACYTAIFSIVNTLKKSHIQSNLYTVYKQNLYNNKRDKSDENFYQYYLPLLKDINHPVLIQEWKKNIDAAAYEKNLNKEIYLPSKTK